MKLNKKTKEYLWDLVSFVGGYETWEDLGIEGMVAIKFFGDYDITSQDLKKALNTYIKKIVKQNNK